MATFTAKNFPSDVGNNKSFSGAGERTTYVPVSKDISIYRHQSGFNPSKSTHLYTVEGYIKKDLTATAKVYFTYPAKLYKNLGDKRGTFAEVSLKSSSSKPDGFVIITHITKPSGAGQARVGAGAKTQKDVADEVEKLANKNKRAYEFVSTARAGSTVPDLIVKYDDKKIQFEIKGTNSSSAPITFFDKSVNRRNKAPQIIDNIAEIFITPELRNKGIKGLVALIDHLRLEDTSIGLAGDEGAPRSGKLPAMLTTTDPTKLDKLRKVIIEHFAEGGDNYFVVHNRSVDKFDIYFTDLGKNVLDYPNLPRFSFFSLATYGGASSGSTRVGLKIKL